MAKVVIIAPAGAEDIDDAVKILKSAGHDVDVEEPSPKTLLHMTLGLFGAGAYGFGPAYAFTGAGTGKGPDKEPKDDAKPDDEETDDASGDDVDLGADFNFESLGPVTVDGELIEAFKINSPTSKLIVESMEPGSKVTYKLNESKYSYWPTDSTTPTQSITIFCNNHRTSITVPIEAGAKAKLLVGGDLISTFAK